MFLIRSMSTHYTFNILNLWILCVRMNYRYYVIGKVLSGKGSGNIGNSSPDEGTRGGAGLPISGNRPRLLAAEKGSRPPSSVIGFFNFFSPTTGDQFRNNKRLTTAEIIKKEKRSTVIDGPKFFLVHFSYFLNRNSMNGEGSFSQLFPLTT